MPNPSPGQQYWEYEFQQQPSREECEDSSLSTVFEHFAMMQRSGWEDIFELLFWNRPSGMGGGQVLFSLQEGWDPGDRGRAGLARGGVFIELSIKSCLLRPDFASVLIFGGKACPHLDPTPWTLPSMPKGTASKRRGCG